MAKILLVEDDNNLREIYEARLQAEGYNIVSAKDGEEALVVAKNEEPDLIISDVMMPKISGFEMLDILRNTDKLKDVKIIMLTALGQADDQARADKLGADRYLVKSQVTLEDIVKVSHELLENNQPAAAPASTPAPEAPAELANPTPSAPDSPSTAPAPEPTVAATPVTPEPVVDPPTPAPAEPVTPAPSPAPTADPVIPATPPTEPVVPPAEPTVTPSTPAEPAPNNQVAIDAQGNLTAQTAAQEESDVEKQIQNFVGTQPAAPASESTTPPTPPTEETAPAPSTEPTPAPTAPDATAAANDATLTSAVDSLVANASPESTTVAPSAEPAPASTPEPAAAPSEESTTPEPSGSGSHGRVIQPISDPTTDSKPDLNALLAAEEAKEAMQAAANGTAPAQPTQPPAAPGSTNPNAAPGSTGIDPNSIAL